MRKCNILIPYACRSDEALTKPLIKAFDKEEWCNVKVIQLEPNDIPKNFQSTIDRGYGFADLSIICGDRVEMMACAMACFHKRIKIAHYGAGILAGVEDRATFDVFNRHCITIWSEIALCEDIKACEQVQYLWDSIGKAKFPFLIYYPSYNIHNVGSLYLEDIDVVDEELVPNEKYDLVLYNFPTMCKELEMLDDIKFTRKIYWIEPNADSYDKEQLLNLMNHVEKKHNIEIVFVENQPRPKYLGLLKNCQRFITNSSGIEYEAPYYLKPEQIIHIGMRNKDRSTDFKKMEGGACKKIVEIIKEWWEQKNE